MEITNSIVQQWTTGRKTKTSSSGWISSNAVCCTNRGYSRDKRKRGGIHTTGDGGVTYSCFNCGFKASFHPGSPLTRNMKLWLGWVGFDEWQILKMTNLAIQVGHEEKSIEELILPSFENKQLPNDSILLNQYNINIDTIPALEYLYDRGLTVESYDFYISSEMKDRIIIPFRFQHRVVGYTARSIIDNVRHKYMSEQSSHYVFNLDKQSYQKTYVLVTEGPFDAISIGGVAILGSVPSKVQHRLISQLNQEIVLVPDRDKKGKDMIDKALEYGWSVSFPEWGEGIKDANDAIRSYGKLATMYQIFNNIESSNIKIQLRTRLYFKNIK